MKIYPDQLKDCDKDRMRALNSKNHYGLSIAEFRDIVEKHRAARKSGNDYKMALIEYRLTDINYHRECGLLEKGLYDEALAIEW